MSLNTIIRPGGLLLTLFTFITLSVVSIFLLPVERFEIAEKIIDSVLTLTITWSSLYIGSRGVEKSIQIIRDKQ